MSEVKKAGVLVPFALVASLVCHVAIHRHFERRSQAALDSVQLQRVPLFSDATPAPSFELLDIGRADSLSMLVNRPHLGVVVQALQLQDDEFHEPLSNASEPLVPVPPPQDSLSVGRSAEDDEPSKEIDTSAVRDVIEHELSHTSREERDIWFDELKTLPAGVVRDLLQVRKQLRALPRLLGGMPEKLASTDPTAGPRTHEVTAEPASQKIRFHVTDSYPAAAALEEAVSQLRHNLINAATPGFKRLRITLVDAYSSGWSDVSPTEVRLPERRIPSSQVWGEGCRVAPTLLDLKQGSLKKTGEPLDLAIDGAGFFAVMVGEKDCFTRCGAFTLDHHRQLCLAVASEDAVLRPVIKIPEEARDIQVGADGKVMYLNANKSIMVVVGQIQLARCSSPARLHPIGQTLFVANEASGEMVFGPPTEIGFGELQQGCLEQSNVDFETELANIDELTMILKALPLPNSRPVTATGKQTSPR